MERRTVIDVEHALPGVEVGDGYADAVVLGKAVAAGDLAVVALGKSGRGERPEVRGKELGSHSSGSRLRLPYEHVAQPHIPISQRAVGASVATAGNEGETRSELVGDRAVGYQLPPGTHPDGGEVLLGKVERRGVVVENRGLAIGFIGGIRAVALQVLGIEIAAAIAVQVVALSRIAQSGDNRVIIKNLLRGKARWNVRPLSGDGSNRVGSSPSKAIATAVELPNLHVRKHGSGTGVSDKLLQRRSAGIVVAQPWQVLQPALARGISGPVFVTRGPTISTGRQPVTYAATAGSGSHVVLEIVPPVHDPENAGMLPVRRVGVAIVHQVLMGENAGNLPWILAVQHTSARQYADVGVNLVVGFGAVLDVETMSDGLPSDVARQQHALDAVKRDPPRHRLIDGRIFDERVQRHLAIHMEMDGVAPLEATLAELAEFHPLDFHLLETLAEDHVSAEVVAGSGWKVGLQRRRAAGTGVAFGNHTNVAREQRDRRTSVYLRAADRLLHIGGYLVLRSRVREAQAARLHGSIIQHDSTNRDRGVLAVRSYVSDDRLFRVSRQVVCGGDDNMIVLFPVHRPVDVELLALSSDIGGQPSPALASVRRIGSHTIERGTFLPEQPQCPTIGDSQRLAPKVIVASSGAVVLVETVTSRILRIRGATLWIYNVHLVAVIPHIRVDAADVVELAVGILAGNCRIIF